MRAAGLKVCERRPPCLLPGAGIELWSCQKIDGLKAQLGQLANLVQHGISENVDVHAAAELDNHELEVLREAGVIPQAALRKVRRKSPSSRVKGKHVLFAEDKAEGSSHRALTRVHVGYTAARMTRLCASAAARFCKPTGFRFAGRRPHGRRAAS